MDGGSFVVAPIGLKKFCFGRLFSNLVLDVLSRSPIILSRKMAGCFTLNKSWLFLMVPWVNRQSVTDISWSYSLAEIICLLAIQKASSL